MKSRDTQTLIDIFLPTFCVSALTVLPQILFDTVCFYLPYESSTYTACFLLSRFMVDFQSRH